MAYEELLAVAKTSAEAAGQLAKQKLAQPRTVTSKGFRDIVTDADFAAQALITDTIQQAFPSHGFLTEEADDSLSAEGEIIWIIDPIDGTTNYSRGLPNFCVSVAALDPSIGQGYDAIVAGVIYDPSRDELFSAIKGQGAQLNGQPMSVSPVTALPEAVVAFDWSRYQQFRLTIHELLVPLSKQAGWMRSIGTAALAMAWTAAGRFDGYLSFKLRQWDLAAGVLLTREAGGRVTDPMGEKIAWISAGTPALFSNRHIHSQLTQLIQDTI